MTIYLDLLFTLNFIYDFLILMTVSITLKRNINMRRIILGALFGAISTFIILLKINKYILLIIKVLSGLLMILITYSYKNIKYTLENILYLYMCSVILAGFLYFLKIEFNNMSYLISLGIAPIILYMYIKEQRMLRKRVNYYRKVIINFKNNKSVTLNGFIDSGNNMKDPVTKKYIILVNKKELKGIYNIRSPMYVPVHTVNKTSLLMCVSIKNLVIDGVIYNNYLLGVSDTFISNSYECLLNNHLLEE